MDSISLQIENWNVSAFDTDRVNSSFYNDEKVFPNGSIAFDHALFMQNIVHEWHNAASFELNSGLKNSEFNSKFDIQSSLLAATRFLD